EKPLLYADEDGAVTFASELRPLAAMKRRDRQLDESALGAYLCLNYVPGDRTLMAGVRRLTPGTWRLYSEAGAASGEYWRPGPEAIHARDLESSLSVLRERIDGAVRLALESDVPVGIFLSGGIDSSLIAESAVRQGGLARAYCLDFPEE